MSDKRSMDDKRHWREECGVVGIAGVPAAAELATHDQLRD